MTCCGKNRTSDPVIGSGFTYVKYEGTTPHRILGGVTGRIYRFDGYGSVVAVSDRDLGSVTAIPKMKIFRQ
jgi:hypothetical protein